MPGAQSNRVCAGNSVEPAIVVTIFRDSPVRQYR